MKHMTLGQIVDYCLEYDQLHSDGQKTEGRRKATQADIDAYFGGRKN